MCGPLMNQVPTQPTIDSLHDIILPAPVGWAPQTAGWWILAVLLGALAVWSVRSLFLRKKRNRYRKRARERLDRIEAALADPATRVRAIGRLPVLIKQTALDFRPRVEVASLSGEPWLRFLDDSYGGTGFTEGPGKILPFLTYGTPKQCATLSTGELTSLVGLVREWIRKHHVRV